MASAIEMTASHQKLSETLKNVRGRWRLKIIVRGIMAVLGATLLAVIVGTWIMDFYRFTPTVVTIVRVGVYACLAAVAWWYCVRLLARTIDDRQVALYLEEHEPSLDAALVSAVEVEAQKLPESLRSSRLLDRTVDIAVSRTQAINGGAAVEKRSIVRSLSVIAATLLLGIVMLQLGPGFLRAGARLLFTPWNDITAVSPYAINVEPGNTTVARGGSQTIRVRLKGFHTKEVDISVKRKERGKWERLPMSATREPDVFEIRLLNIEEGTTYFVETYRLRSPDYRLEVVDRPAVRTISLEFRYPQHTGMATAWVEDGGDITAPVGTSVLLRAKTTMPVTAAQIVVEGQSAIPMTVEADGTLSGAITPKESGFYTIELQSVGNFIAGTIPYTIEALEDHRPKIAFRKPGRDLPVHPSDKIVSQIEAVDDYSVSSIELVYSLNGGVEQSVSLYSSKGRQRNVAVEHTFALEKFSLKPGDFLSYYARTLDNDSAGGKIALSDLYFLHVRSPQQDKDQPIEEEFDESENGLNTLSRLQQDIINRTFKAERDKPTQTQEEHAENATTIMRAQVDLSDRIVRIVEQMKNRSIESFDAIYRTITKDLTDATEGMRAASNQLINLDLLKALDYEKRALRSLQKSEMAFQTRRRLPADSTSIYFRSFEPTANDLDQLFDIESDTVPKDSAKRAKQDDADERVLKLIGELKRITGEQEKEDQRRKQRLAQSQKTASDGGNVQRQLAYETETLARRLGKDARDNEADYALGTTETELLEASKAMQLVVMNVNNGQRADSIMYHLNHAREILEKRQEQRAEQISHLDAATQRRYKNAPAAAEQIGFEVLPQQIFKPRQDQPKVGLQPVMGGAADVPNGFKELVAEYFRSVAKHKKAAANK